MTIDVALVMGLAGTGKTTLTGALVRWMKRGVEGERRQPRSRGQEDTL